MTDETGRGPIAGWYPDPDDARYLRWWNGHKWELRKPAPVRRGGTDAVGDRPQNVPVEGWYPDPDDARYLRWWNGHKWELRKPVPGVHSDRPAAAAPGTGFNALARVLGVLFVFVIMGFAARLALYVWGFTMIEDAVEAGDIEAVATFDDLDRAIGWSLIGLIVVTGIFWMTWQFRLARTVPGLLRSPAMHAFSWIIPIAALWLPFQNVKELWQRCVSLRGIGALRWWWAGWLSSFVFARVATAMASSADAVSDVKPMLVVNAAGTLVATATALLGVRIVRSITAGATTGEFHDLPRPTMSVNREILPDDAW